MRKFGKRFILGSMGVAVVVVASMMAYFKGEQHGREAAEARIQSVEQARDENSRTISHSDGTRSVYIRNEGQESSILRRYHFSRSGELFRMTLYRVDEKGNALTAKIFDGRKEELFKVSFGYRISDGILAEERIFDSKTKRISPDDGKELPVWRVIHTWDDHGKPTGPTIIKGVPDSEIPQGEITPFVNPFTI